MSITETHTAYETVTLLQPSATKPRPLALLGKKGGGVCCGQQITQLAIPLSGPPGVGRDTIKQRLLTLYSDVFALCIPRKPEGQVYRLPTRICR